MTIKVVILENIHVRGQAKDFKEDFKDMKKEKEQKIMQSMKTCPRELV